MPMNILNFVRGFPSPASVDLGGFFILSENKFTMLPEEVIKKFGIEDHSVKPFGLGLINDTWMIENNSGEKKFILQRINQNIFKVPENIAYNIRLVSDYLKQHHPEYLFAASLKTKDGTD